MTTIIKAELELTRTGRFVANILEPKIWNTGHEISEDSGLFTVQSIINGKLLCHNATREQAERDIAMEWLAFAALHKPETSRELDARWDSFPTFGQKAATNRLRSYLADQALRPILKPGDRLRANKAECGAKEASFIFSHWEHGWIVSTGGSSIAPGSVYSINHEIFRI
ncbi:hypothetical protein RvVAT039_02520 [Agrobacterium vitis]|uniref:hypothetical protein n=1 Tax=Agrobacterium vitis TaxID=373 RepID=UPI0015DA7CB4|nr:hypothetical protein [Agrobacterium vitis]BCH63036.1 hypothetical protein RvVAT039_02520 [Agrobacterium vitis]